MNASGDAAEQIVRMTLQGVEVAGKMSMDGAERLVKLILASLKDTKRTKGRASLNTMLKSNKPIKVFELKDKDLKKFCQEAKKYGVMYHVLKDRDKNDGKCDIMVRAEDSAKVNRIFQRFNLGANNKATVRASLEKSKGDIKVTSKDTNFGSSVKTSERYILKMDSQSGSGKNRYWTGLPAETVLVKGKMCENTYTLRNILLGAGYIKQSGAWYSIDENICKALGIESSKKQITALNQLIKDNASTFFNILKESDDFHVVPKNAVETEVSADELEDEE